MITNHLVPQLESRHCEFCYNEHSVKANIVLISATLVIIVQKLTLVIMNPGQSRVVRYYRVWLYFEIISSLAKTIHSTVDVRLVNFN